MKSIKLISKYQENEISEFGYRYVLALRNEIQNASLALKELEKEYNQKKSQSALSDLNKFDSNWNTDSV